MTEFNLVYSHNMYFVLGQLKYDHNLTYIHQVKEEMETKQGNANLFAKHLFTILVPHLPLSTK